MPIFSKPKRPKAEDRTIARVAPRKLSFTAPASRDVFPELADALDTQENIMKSRAADVAARKLLQEEIAADKSPDVDPDVAALIGETPSEKAIKRQQVAELKRKELVAGSALEIIEKRIAAMQPKAERAVCVAVRPEADLRLAALCEALKAVDVAHAELNDLLLAVEAQGVSTDGLGQIRPHFLGGAQDPQRRIAGYLKEVREAGCAV
ncbi:hypothetical protein [Mesorhizobium mediterraneum]|uniref:hypothetical protein n=1 Tax=Mesorhizobium mediterraneum TaxID=43617 RepID=UPI00177ACA00|nr:hypothetical protein [Mesorhizobium mediterraneum]